VAFVDLRFYSINSHDLRRIDTRIKEIESEAEREREGDVKLRERIED